MARASRGQPKSNRKAGKPAQQRYTQAARWATNKERRIAKEARRQARLKERAAARQEAA